ncbi:hypothetical protein [Rhodococcus sp. HNM0569]|uniref:hypothetical protein n=1 Tax=Rhodococcus sp. HNM0569 TaxID=2716340 RepID=UPI00146BB2D1|nr:hypothetical protein [Rhodococcus sp. HNM0569]NLU83615.1 hypothetical protein [Rhodococcus sp. HNM0569]
MATAAITTTRPYRIAPQDINPGATGRKMAAHLPLMGHAARASQRFAQHPPRALCIPLVPEPGTVDVLFPLRAGTESEPGRWAGKEPAATLMRLPAAHGPELCAAHGRAGTWSRRFRIYARPETEHDRKSPRRQILHDLVFSWTELGRVIKRIGTAPSTQWTFYGCSDCRAWLRGHRIRALLRFAVSIFLMIGLPLILGGTSLQVLGSILMFVGLFFFTYSAAKARWADQFTRATVSDDGDWLVLRAPHPDYVVGARTTGADTRAEQGSERPPWWKVG